MNITVEAEPGAVFLEKKKNTLRLSGLNFFDKGDANLGLVSFTCFVFLRRKSQDVVQASLKLAM